MTKIQFFLIVTIKTRIFSFGHLTTFYGTGSYPLPPHGWQLLIRFIDSRPPLSIPYFLIASMVYWEQVGLYLQRAGNSGDILYL